MKDTSINKQIEFKFVLKLINFDDKSIILFGNVYKYVKQTKR